MGFLSKLGFGSKTKTTNALSGQQLSDLNSAINARGQYQQQNVIDAQNVLQTLLQGYDPTSYEQAVRTASTEKANEAQQKLLSQASGLAGSAFNTAAQSAAQRSTASAVADINQQAQDAIENYKQNYLTNLLTQYGNQTTEYQNLLEQLIGQRTMQTKPGILGKLIGGTAGAFLGGPTGAAAGMQFGDLLDQ